MSALQPYYHNADADITIYHGNCRDLLPTLGAFDALITDPPYGISHPTDYRRFPGGVAKGGSVHAPVFGDDEPFDPRPLLTVAPSVVLFGANCFSDSLPQGSWLIWDKRTLNGNKNVMSDGEAAWWSN